jgi:type IV secretory pathway VirB9-like protein
MRKTFCLSLLIVLSGSISAQTKDTRIRNTAKTVFEGQPATLRLAAHLTTTIRLPEPVNSVIVGDSNLFQAEHSPSEPLLVFVKPVTSTVAQSNLVISTARGDSSF